MKQWITMFCVAAGAITGWASDGVIEISQLDMESPPYIINESGSYILTENLIVTNTDVNGIEVQANYVTLDMNGFQLKGPGTRPEFEQRYFSDRDVPEPDRSERIDSEMGQRQWDLCAGPGSSSGRPECGIQPAGGV